ncbi:MAG TPA: AI-2E family transporter [Desulfobulbaceae bacterium]|nr:MAG: AI-2E family transporter [Deltaproteobacteria bacterium RIFOXYD12_FULL_53_23]HCC54272.1 AI-2E family transporter [Desulfobulbaceae bacterium]
MDRTLFTTLLAYTVTVLFMYLLFAIFSPFLAMLVWAGTIGIITYPFYEKLLARCHGREVAAATLMTTAVLLALIIPLLGLIFSLTQEAALAYQYLERASNGTSGLALANIMSHPSVAAWRERLRPLTDSLNLELNDMLLQAIKKGIAFILNYSSGIVKNFLGFVFKVVLLLITLFFIYKDGQRFLHRFWLIVPLNETLQTAMSATVIRVLRAVTYGVILTCLAQGALGGLGFWVAGLPSPFLFGTLMAICAPIPFIGTALIWLPGAIYLLMQGQMLHGLLLITWGVLVVSSIDNILRPWFISGKAKLPILLIVFGVLGGILAFGLSGLMAGPVILAIIMVFFDACREAPAADPDLQ